MEESVQSDKDYSTNAESIPEAKQEVLDNVASAADWDSNEEDNSESSSYNQNLEYYITEQKKKDKVVAPWH